MASSIIWNQVVRRAVGHTYTTPHLHYTPTYTSTVAAPTSSVTLRMSTVAAPTSSVTLCTRVTVCKIGSHINQRPKQCEV
jgi:hypothetical protein